MSGQDISIQSWQHLLNSGDQAACLMDKDLRILSCNAAMGSLVGKEPRQLAGLSCCRAVHGGEELVANCPLARMLESGQPEKKLVAVADRHFEAAVHPFFNRSGDISHMLHTFSDVAHGSASRQTLLKLQSLEHVGEISRGVAHDLNNVLTMVTGTVAVMKTEEAAPSKFAEMFEGIEQAALRGTDLCKQLVALSSDGAPFKSAVSLSNVIRESAELAMMGSWLQLTMEVDEDLWPCLAHEEQIAQVIINLVMNARQASDRGSIVHVEARNVEGGVAELHSGKFVKIVVQDRGSGIRQEDLAKIFAPFFTTKESGTGLGLATVDAIVREHMGHIAVESETGLGATFVVHLPAFDPEIGDAPCGRSFAEVIESGSFCLNLASNTKEGIIKEMIDRIVADGNIEDREAAVSAVLARENSMSTGMQHGVALPHGKSSAVDELVVAFGLKRDGVDFDSLDGQPCRIFVMTLSPLHSAGSHVKVLAETSKALRDPLRRKRIIEATSRDEIVKILTD